MDFGYGLLAFHHRERLFDDLHRVVLHVIRREVDDVGLDEERVSGVFMMHENDEGEGAAGG